VEVFQISNVSEGLVVVVSDAAEGACFNNVIRNLWVFLPIFW
jgi:hypothetical protein